MLMNIFKHVEIIKFWDNKKSVIYHWIVYMIFSLHAKFQNLSTIIVIGENYMLNDCSLNM